MKKRILVLALVFSVVLSALCAPTAGAAGKTAMPEEYAPVIETYYSIIYGNWYVPLTAEDLVNMGACPLLAEFDWDEKRSFGCYLEDINGDGTPELFLGVDNTEFNDQVYQLFTVNKGQLSCLYTATGEDAVYLLKDGLLEYELWGSDDSYAMCVYRLAKNGGVSVTEGVLYDKNAKKGPYFSISDDSFNAAKGKAISERKYNQKLEAVAKKEKYLRYDPIINWYTASSGTGSGSGKTPSGGKAKTGSSDPRVNTGEAASLYYTHQTTVDNTTGAKTANILVPYGWRLEHSVDWYFIDTTSPGVATVALSSPDGKAVIKLFSNQQFYDMHKNSAHVAEGVDLSLYCSNLHYRDAGELQTLGLQGEGYSDARLVKSYTVPDALLRIAQEGAKVKLQSSTSGTGAAPLASEGTVAQKQYKSGSKYIEYLTMVTAAATQANTGHVVLTAISWNVPLNCMFIADSKQSYDRYRDVFPNVVANSGFTAEFHFVNLKYGSVISNLISQGLLEQSRRYLQSGSSTWISEYESSPGYDSDRLTSQWSDVIKEQNEYTTLDGDTIKVSTAYDTVYQDGDRIYMGPEGQSPYGWTRLYPN